MPRIQQERPASASRAALFGFRWKRRLTKRLGGYRCNADNGEDLR